MAARTKKQKTFDEMSNKELEELQDGYLTIRKFCNDQIEVILEEMQDRLEHNFIK